MARKRQARTPGTKRDTRRPLKAEPVDKAALRREQKTLLGRVADGDYSFREVYALVEDEARQVHELSRRESAWLRRASDEKPPMAAGSVPPITRSLKVRDVLVRLPKVDEPLADLILQTYELDGGWRLDEIGTAEADVIDNAVRLVLQARAL